MKIARNQPFCLEAGLQLSFCFMLHVRFQLNKKKFFNVLKDLVQVIWLASYSPIPTKSSFPQFAIYK